MYLSCTYVLSRLVPLMDVECLKDALSQRGFPSQRDIFVLQFLKLLHFIMHNGKLDRLTILTLNFNMQIILGRNYI